MTATTAGADIIGKTDATTLGTKVMTPEALWAMGRISASAPSPDGKWVVYQVGYYSLKENKSHHVLYLISADGGNAQLLTVSANNETDPAWIDGGKRIAFLSNTGGSSQLWSMNPDGTDRRQLTSDKTDIEGFRFSPDGKKVILIKSLPYNDIIQPKHKDLPKASGMVINDLNYRHWDHYVTSNAHPFVADVKDITSGTEKSLPAIGEGKDILEGEPYECPMAPFGGVEQLNWSPDSKSIAYTCRKKTGRDYAISTDSDIYLYDTLTGLTKNLCKSADFKQPEVDATKTMATQEINSGKYADENMGYDTNPAFSPNGKYIAWQSMARDGYESDRNRLCILELATGKKRYVTESFDSNVDDFCWNNDSRTLYYIGVWHGCVNLYRTDLEGKVVQLTDDKMDFGSVKMIKSKLLMSRHSMSQGDELYIITPGKNIKTTAACQLTHENSDFYRQLEFGEVEARWSTTTDGKEMLSWIVLPPNFDPEKKYPTLLFCEGGPQSPVSQFWSYRWNFQIMAANGYIVVAPNRRGLPGFGQEWLEEISGDWTGQCMKDYLTAIDDACTLPYVDKNRLGCVGASFGGFSVYWLAGNHDKRFKAFISHDGAFNLESMYTDTEEAWFSNWEYDDAPWNSDMTARAKRTYDSSPHKFVDKWDTPILCIQGEKDYRINTNQGLGAFNAARMRGVPAQLLVFPDENHWVLKPQNGILWQRTFFDWLNKWLKD
ncbi:MAG: S9 family peptidase [Bacteroidales bacterium]|nr:S9 family peptidase [Bacteroidales bacterium]MCM1146726.1 S9 family peptidase [Bacteroidales bacterium]MCM1205543.1 S9 family peptidase [Bacillota bacterium]